MRLSYGRGGEKLSFGGELPGFQTLPLWGGGKILILWKGKAISSPRSFLSCWGEISTALQKKLHFLKKASSHCSTTGGGERGAGNWCVVALSGGSLSSGKRKRLQQRKTY